MFGKMGLQDLVLTVDGNAHDHRLVASANFQSPAVAKTFRDNVSIASTYSIQFGLRYLFN